MMLSVRNLRSLPKRPSPSAADDPSRILVRRWAVRLCWSAIALGAIGCSGSGANRPVSGTVKLPDGTPIVGGLVLFRPLGANQKPARGAISADGSFRLSTSQPNDGAAPGEYQVVISSEPPIEVIDDPVKRAAYKSPLDKRYENPDTTPLKYTVDADAENHFDIVVQPPGAKRR